MRRIPSLLFPLILFPLFGALVLGGCAQHQIRQPPPGFEPGAPILTGDAALDARVARAQHLATLDDAGFSTLRKSADSTHGGQEAVFDLTMAYLARGDAGSAMEVLLRWAEATEYSDLAMAAYIDVALGSERLEDCITATDTFLRAHRDHPWVHIARGVCLERFQRHHSAQQSYIEGLQFVGTFAGHSGTLERELGLISTPPNLPQDALHKERLDLIEALADANLVGHVALRHRTGIEPDEFPIDPRLAGLGGLTTADIDQVFVGRREAFRHCQLLSAEKRSIPGGRLVVHLTIRRDGSPGAIEHIRSTFEVEEIPACLDQQVLNMWFPQPRYGKALKYEREFRMAGD